MDELVNHSCDPNCGLIERGGHVFLVTLRGIRAGEELTFDYATSMTDEPWGISCACGASACRGVIGSFRDLPDDLRERYLVEGLVPGHVADDAIGRISLVNRRLRGRARAPRRGRTAGRASS